MRALGFSAMLSFSAIKKRNASCTAYRDLANGKLRPGMKRPSKRLPCQPASCETFVQILVGFVPLAVRCTHFGDDLVPALTISPRSAASM
jgi:hypothetical protein